MTRVEFFFNVEDKAAKVSALAQAAVRKGRRLLLFTDSPLASQQLSAYLWSHPAQGFVPHCMADDAVVADTPIILDSSGEPLAHDDILINLRPNHPPFFSRFRRLIEIVGLDEADKVHARQRFKFYRDRGYEIRTFDAQGKALST